MHPYCLDVHDRPDVSDQGFQVDMCFTGGVDWETAGAIVAVARCLGVAPIRGGSYEELLELQEVLEELGYRTELRYKDPAAEDIPFAKWCRGEISAEEFDRQHAVWLLMQGKWKDKDDQ